MKLLNVPPVKPGQKFKYRIGNNVYVMISIQWSFIWDEWDARVKIVRSPYGCDRLGETVSILIDPYASLEILND